MNQAMKRAVRKKPIAPNHLRKFRIHKGDTVVVLAGKDKGKTGVVRRILTKSGKVIVEGLNMVKKAVKPNPMAGLQGGLIEMEAPMPICKVMVMDLKVNKPTRIKMTMVKDAATGKPRRVRTSVKSGEQFDI
ncbi:MAG: 50S ribosomal protein L24 [Vampirovibrionales bacterium]|nr:50S ribosomal protein L24 [Vampirovibrionales bacterium]